MKHALLPWRVETTCAGTSAVFPTNDGGSNPFAVCHIGELQRTPAEVKEIGEFIVRAANAHDDLLAACKAMVAEMEERCTALGWGSVEEYRSAHHEADGWYGQARAAIALAEGTSDA